MRIRMMTGIAGPNWSASPGVEIEIQDHEATRLIAAGYARPVGLEVATVAPQENAALRTRPPNQRSGKVRVS